MATSSVTTDYWDPGVLFFLSKELSDKDSNLTLVPGTGDDGAGMGIGMGDAPL